MAAPEEVYRDYVTRTHRTMAAYLATVAWVRKLDCLAMDRVEIVRFWGLSKRVEEQRLDWLKEDVRQFFPFVQPLYQSTGTKKFASVFLSRRQFPTGAFDKSLNTVERAKELTGNGISTAVVQLPTEVEMLTQLTAVIHGLAGLPVPATLSGQPVA